MTLLTPTTPRQTAGNWWEHHAAAGADAEACGAGATFSAEGDPATSEVSGGAGAALGLVLDEGENIEFPTNSEDPHRVQEASPAILLPLAW